MCSEERSNKLEFYSLVTDQVVIYSSVLYTISHENLVSIYLLNALT